MKYVIAGSRSFNDYILLTKVLDKVITSNDTIISGMASGADMLGVRYAKEHNLQLLKYPAHWDLYGRSAGYKRNEQMAIATDKVIVFWDEESKGTKHMIDLAHKHKKPVMIVRYKTIQESFSSDKEKNPTPCRSAKGF